MHHGPEFTVVLIFGLTLAVGAATRLFAIRTRFPYTILMLLLGLGTGLAIRLLTGEGGGDHGGHGGEHEAGGGGGLLSLIGAGSEISSDLIIFVFLPALVFEAAFAIEVHRFRKNLGAVLVMAVPALVVATLLTAALMVGLTAPGWAWGWPAALVFGALISATDPVAVVAILGELGVSKRLGVLIEGESLFNDGTAIVIFTLLIGLLTGEATSIGVGEGLFELMRVALGGILLGFGLAYVLSSWIERLFNDPIAEITLTLVLAYACMIIGEGLLHVSGVMAVVVAGLWMSGRGRTQVSPEVAHFLHRFWHMLGYIANTLIFFLVGLAMAKAVESATASDLLLIVLAYAGIMTIRFALTFATRPITTRLSEGISAGDCAVIAWGGLRGAVSLALALIVSQHPRVAPEIGDQVLLVSTGVVLLTILVNGTTIGALLARLGYDKPPLSEQLARLSARANVLDEVRQAIRDLSSSRDLRTVSWGEVEARLDERRGRLEGDLAGTREDLAARPDAERMAGDWRQALSIERQVYWEAFSKGTLGADAVKLLSREIDGQLDRLDRGDMEPPGTRMPRNPYGLVAWLRRLLRGGALGFAELELLYELSRAEYLAAKQVLESLGSLKGVAPPVLERIRETYESHLRAGKERIEDFRTNAPEMAAAIEARLARRIELNHEREGFERLEHHGVLDEATAEAEIASVEARMHELRRTPTRVEIPKTVDLVAATPLLRALDEAALRELAALTQERVYPAGTYLCREGERGDSLLVIARGAVHVTRQIGGEEVFVDVLGGGDVIGEMSLMTGAPRNASIRATTAVTAGTIGRDAFEHLMETQPTLRRQLWRVFAQRNFDNTVRSRPEFSHLEREDCTRWLEAGRSLELAPGQAGETGSEERYAFVLTGALRLAGREHRALALVETAAGDAFQALAASRVVMLPAPVVTRPVRTLQGDALATGASA